MYRNAIKTVKTEKNIEATQNVLQLKFLILRKLKKKKIIFPLKLSQNLSNDYTNLN